MEKLNSSIWQNLPREVLIRIIIPIINKYLWIHQKKMKKLNQEYHSKFKYVTDNEKNEEYLVYHIKHKKSTKNSCYIFKKFIYSFPLHGNITKLHSIINVSKEELIFIDLKHEKHDIIKNFIVACEKMFIF